MTTLNRLTRDGIINRALDLADVPALDAHDRPSNPTIDASAFAIEWLQEGIDWFHQQMPMAGLVSSATVTITTTGSLALPADFLLDFRNGLVVTDAPAWRLVRISYQEYITRAVMAKNNAATSQPVFYVVVPPNILVVNQNGALPDKSYAGTLYYFALPAALTTAQVPNFPSDLVLVDYVKLKAMEWVRAVPPGTALQYAMKGLGDLRKAGLFNDPEPMEIPLDERHFVGMGVSTSSPWGWMGDFLPKQ